MPSADAIVAVHLLRDNKSALSPHTLFIVDEAAMVGTDPRPLITATTRADTKPVFVGDQHQLAAVRARGGMFAQVGAPLVMLQLPVSDVE